MEISKEIKDKVFAQYISQNVLHNGVEVVNLDKSWNWQHPSFKLVLKPLSSITDEDVIWVYDTIHNLHQQRKLQPEYVNRICPSLNEMKEQISIEHNHWIKNTWVYQYLILKGYDLPHLLLGYKTLEQSGLAIYK